ncbi:MAG: DNA repair protein RecO [Candidatus Acidiferrales bacterium]
MPLAESEAVILRSSNFGEADKLVSFFSRSLGRLRGVAPNARRSRRRFGAALEPLSHVRLWFFEREGDELVRLSESELIEPFYDARGDFERSVALNQVAELSDLLLPEREAAERSFRLLLAVLRGFRQSDAVWLPLTYFQLWMVRLAGWLPSLENCTQCRRTLSDEPAYVNPATGKLYCARCRKPGARLLGASSRTDAAAMLSNPLDKLAAEGWDRRRAAELQALLLDIIEIHAERKLVTRELLCEKA